MLLNEKNLRDLAEQGLRKKGLYTFLANEELIKEARTFSEYKTYDIFLSHSTTDAAIIYGVKTIIENQGLSVFVYWIENPSALTNPVTKETASKLRSKMRVCRSLLYAHSEAASHSRWMPWELGYMDGFKGKVAVLPIARGEEMKYTYSGQEYLGIYPWVGEDYAGANRLSVYDGVSEISKLDAWIRK